MPSDSTISGLTNECTDPALTDYLALDDGSAANETKKITVANFLGGIAGNIVINEAGGAYDLRVESDNNANMFHIDGDVDIAELIGTLTAIDSGAWAATLVRMGYNMTAEGSATPGSANQAVLNIHSYIDETTPAAANYEKKGIFVRVHTAEPSTGGITRDAVGVRSHGEIVTGNTTGRAWGLTAIAATSGTGDGLLCGLEIDVDHGGSDQPLVDTTTSKYGLQIITEDHDSTAAMKIGGSGGSKWHKGIYIDTTAMDTEANDTLIEAGTAFIVKPTGAITATGDMSIDGAAIFNDTGADKDHRIETSGSANMVFVDGGLNRVGIGTATPKTVLDVAGQITQQTNVVRAVITKNAIPDNSATEIFTITTTNEAGSNDGGVYSVKVHGVVAHGYASTATKVSCKSFGAQFCRAIDNGGTGTNSAVMENLETASAAPDAGTKDVGTVTMTLAETSEYVNSIQLLVDCTGTGAATADVTFMVELVYMGFLTPPVIV